MTGVRRSSSLKEEFECIWKVVLCGDSGVGKSNLLLRYTRNEFRKDSKTTIGVEFGNRDVVVDQLKVRAQIWDTAGQEKFKAMAGVYYRKSAGAVIVYDITKHESFRNVPKWLTEVREHSDERTQLILVGNKQDLRHLRAVTVKEAEEYAEQEGLLFIETSAQDDVNVHEAFDMLYQRIHSKQQEALEAAETAAAQTLILPDTTQQSSPEPKKKGKGLKSCCKT